MSGHSRWVGVPALPDKAALEIQLAYVDGYILALEDMFKDIAQLGLPNMPEATGAIRAYRKELRRTLSISMESARRTRKLFQDQYEGKEPHDQTNAGRDGDHPGPDRV